jgi:ABC-type Fe3+ transport system substrate-binding protein
LGLFTAAVAACAPGAAPEGGNVVTGEGGDKWEATQAAAKKEGKVVWVTHTDLVYKEMAQDFQKAYPDIQLDHQSIRPSEFAPKLLAEQQNGLFTYDLWSSPTSNMVTVALPAGAFQNLEQFLIRPDVKDPSNYRGNKLMWASKEPYILLDRGNVDGGVYVNRDVLSKTQFSSLDQLMDPSLKGKITIRTPNAPHGGSLNLTGFLNAKGEKWVEDFMTKQEPQYIENARLLTQNLINGKVGLAIGIDGATLDQCQVAGGCKNIEQIKGWQYLLGNGLGVLKNAPHPNATAVMVNWLMSKAGRESYIKGLLATTPAPYSAAHSNRKDVEPHPDAVKEGAVPDYDNLSKYSLQGMEQGNPHMEFIINTYKKIEGGAR